MFSHPRRLTLRSTSCQSPDTHGKKWESLACDIRQTFGRGGGVCLLTCSPHCLYQVKICVWCRASCLTTTDISFLKFISSTNSEWKLISAGCNTALKSSSYQLKRWWYISVEVLLPPRGQKMWAALEEETLQRLYLKGFLRERALYLPCWFYCHCWTEAQGQSDSNKAQGRKCNTRERERRAVMKSPSLQARLRLLFPLSRLFSLSLLV